MLFVIPASEIAWWLLLPSEYVDAMEELKVPSIIGEISFLENSLDVPK